MLLCEYELDVIAFLGRSHELADKGVNEVLTVRYPAEAKDP